MNEYFKRGREDALFCHLTNQRGKSSGLFKSLTDNCSFPGLNQRLYSCKTNDLSEGQEAWALTTTVLTLHLRSAGNLG